MGLTRLTTVVALLLAGLIIASPAKVDAAPGCSSGAVVGDGGGTARGCQQQEAGPGPGGSSGPGVSQEDLWNRHCTQAGPYAPGNSVLISQEGALSAAEADRMAVPADYVRYQITCQPNGFVFFTALPPGAAQAVDPLVLRAAAQARIEPPEPTVGSNPPSNNPDIPGIVQVPTWFWVTDPWEPITETEAQGGVTVTVSATPRNVTWNPGDGNQSLVCGGPGVVWAPGISEDATDCSYIYKSSSADEPNESYNVTSTITWVFTWTLNGAEQGEFGTIDTSTEFTYQVGEIQAIEREG